MNILSIRTLMLLLSFALISGCGDDETTEPDCTVGASCNDGDSNTINDVYDANCDCAGTQACTVGADCDDGDNTTLNDIYNANCECVGTATACTGIGDADDDGVCTDVDCNDADELNTNYPGLACDDGNADTENDAINNDCDCVGDCTITGSRCDDGDDNTYNDVFNADCECEGTAYGSFTDPRDAQVYLTVEIGTQTWMAENLNYETAGSICYAGQADNCTIYGRMYNWNLATTMGCPTGWHIPNDTEWDALRDYLDPSAVLDNNDAGGKMKEAGTEHWNMPNVGATNTSGFTALPGGVKLIGTGLFAGIGTNATWWSASEDGVLAAWHRNILFGGPAVTRGSSLKGDNFSVRCIKD